MKISVCMTTYNHERFIERAIEGVLMQRSQLPIELVIGDDDSTDDTGRICEMYARRFPDRIRYLRRNPNRGMMPNFVETLAACDGKYIAICEGDDYWIDENKLALQTNLLESDSEIPICCHDHFILKNEKLINARNKVDKDVQLLSTADYLKDPFFHTSSYFFRNDAQPINYPGWFRDVLAGDHFLVLFLSLKGKIAYINRPMSVFRHHDASISFTKDPLAIKENFTKHLGLFNTYTDSSYQHAIEHTVRKWDLIYKVYEDTSYVSKISHFMRNLGFYAANFSKVGGFKLLAKYLITANYFDHVKKSRTFLKERHLKS
jgi:glycosyltransferase involved in cell wall biosynthesis